MSENNTGKIIGAGLLGLGVGAVVALLMSPKSGKENRKDFNEWTERLSDELNDRTHQIKDMTQEKYNALVDTISDKYRRAQGIKETELDDFVKELKTRWGRIKDQWQDKSISDYTDVQDIK